MLATVLWGNNSSPTTTVLPVQKLNYPLPSAKLPPAPLANLYTPILPEHAKTRELSSKNSDTNAGHKGTYLEQNTPSPTVTVYSNTARSSAEVHPVISQRTIEPEYNTAQPSFAVPSNNSDIAEVLKAAVDHNDISVIKSLLRRPEIASQLNKPLGGAALIQLAELPDDPEAVSILTEILNTEPSLYHFILSSVAKATISHNNAPILKLVLARPEAKASLRTPLERKALSQLARLMDDPEAVEMIKERLNTNHLVSGPILVEALVKAVKYNNTSVLKLLLPHPEIIPSLKASLGPTGARALSQLIALPNDQEAIAALTEILKSGHPLNNSVLSDMLKAADKYKNVPVLKLLMSQPKTINYLKRSLEPAEVSLLSQLAALPDDQEAVTVLKKVWDLELPLWFYHRALPSVLTAAIEHDNGQIIELLRDRLEPRYTTVKGILKLLTVATVHNNLDVINGVIANKELTNRKEIAKLNKSIPKHALDLLHLAVQRQNNKLVEWLLKQDQIEIKDPQYFLTCILNHSPSSNVLNLFKIVHEAGANKVQISLKDPETEGTILDYVMFKIKSLQELANGGSDAGEIPAEALGQDIAEYEHLKNFLIEIGVEHTSDFSGPIHSGIEVEIQHTEMLGNTINTAS